VVTQQPAESIENRVAPTASPRLADAGSRNDATDAPHPMLLWMDAALLALVVLIFVLVTALGAVLHVAF
jgi:hypothetical protein